MARLPAGKRRKSPSYASCRKLNRTACRHRESADWPCTLRDCRSSAGEHRPVLPKRGVLKIGFECSIIYRLLLLIGAPSLRIETLSQSVRSSIQLAEPEPIRLSWPRSERCRTKGNTVELPSILQGESLTRLLQGAAAGAVATIVVGFYWGGWSLGSTANKMATERSELAVVAALAPVCADKFRACLTPRRSKSRFRRSTRGSAGTNSPRSS